MKVNFIEVNKIRLAHFEKNSDANQTIFFIHGNSVSKRSWRKQYNSPVLSDYRMIAIDLPSHGDSNEGIESFYTLKGLAGIMSNTVGQLAAGKPYILVGISLSTNIIAEMLAFDVKPEGLVLAGPCIVGKGYEVSQFVKPNTHVGVVFTDHSDENDILSYAHETSASRDPNDVEIFMEDFKSVKGNFRSPLAKSIMSGEYSDEIELLQQKNIPLLIVFGKNEIVVDENYLDNAVLPIWNKTIYKIEGSSHLVNIDQPEEFNKLLKKFADDIFK
jgi:pimeloyl-ACP methyl ester carboxylesterase